MCPIFKRASKLYRLGSFKVFPSKNSPSILSRSSAVYLMYFWGFFPLSTRGLQQNEGNYTNRRPRYN
jgi:hypothetical protein